MIIIFKTIFSINLYPTFLKVASHLINTHWTNRRPNKHTNKRTYEHTRSKWSKHVQRWLYLHNKPFNLWQMIHKIISLAYISSISTSSLKCNYYLFKKNLLSALTRIKIKFKIFEKHVRWPLQQHLTFGILNLRQDHKKVYNPYYHKMHCPTHQIVTFKTRSFTPLSDNTYSTDKRDIQENIL
jgi:hypothetical protein